MIKFIVVIFTWYLVAYVKLRSANFGCKYNYSFQDDIHSLVDNPIKTYFTQIISINYL
jgi:hypothetical protein